MRFKVNDGHQNRGPFQALSENKYILPSAKCQCRVGAAIVEMF